jgi:peroxiredoxin
MKILTPLLVGLGLAAAACNNAPPVPVQEPGKSIPDAVPAPVAAAGAKVGEPAPDFTLTDYDGKSVHLADLKGKTVVLEWFNPDCPFVKASHTKGSLRDSAKRHAAEGVVWLGVNSSAAGKQGNAPDRVAAGKQAFGLDHPILADASGQVGHLYGATNTPHLYVIDPKGILVYRGAIDNSPDGEGDSPQGGKLINYVDTALSELAAGKPITTKQTEAYGCGVKYGS